MILLVHIHCPGYIGSRVAFPEHIPARSKGREPALCWRTFPSQDQNCGPVESTDGIDKAERKLVITRILSFQDLR